MGTSVRRAYARVIIAVTLAAVMLLGPLPFDMGLSGVRAQVATPTSDVSVDKVADRDTADVGEEITYTVTASVVGPDPVDAVTLTDTLSGVAASIVAVDGGPAAVCAPPDGATVVCDVEGPFAAGSEITLQVRAAASAEGTLTNTITSSATGAADPDPDNNAASYPVTITPPPAPAPDLAANAVAWWSEPRPYVGTNVGVYLDLYNIGNATAEGVVLTQTVPAGVTGLSCEAYNGNGTSIPIDCSAHNTTGGVISAPIGNMNSGGWAYIQWMGSPASTGTLTSTVEASTASAEPNTANNSDSASIDVVELADEADLFVDGHSLDEINEGQSVEFGADIYNNGPISVHDGVVTATIPAGLGAPDDVYFYSDGGTGSDEGGGEAVALSVPDGDCLVNTTNVVCPLGDFADGHFATLRLLYNQPPIGSHIVDFDVASAATPDPYNGNNHSSSPVVVNDVSDEADLYLSEVEGYTDVAEGEYSWSYVNAYNDGPRTVTDAVLTATIPFSLPATPTYLYMGSDGGTTEDDCTVANRVVTCPLGSFAPGADAYLELDFGVTPAGSHTIAYGIGGSSTIPDPDLSDNESSWVLTVEDTVADEADLYIGYTEGDSTREPGDDTYFYAEVYNNGPNAATDAVITATVPAGLGFDPSGIYLSTWWGEFEGSDCTFESGIVTCPVGVIEAGGWTSLRLDFYDIPAGTHTVEFGVGRATMPDPDLGNNTASWTTAVVEHVADLSITKTAPGTARVGDLVSWSLQFANAGPDQANGTVITDTLPPGTVFSSASVYNEYWGYSTCSAAAQVVTCDAGPLGSGYGGSATVTAVVTDEAPGTITNTAGIRFAGIDNDLSDNQASASTTMSGAATADIQVSKTLTSPATPQQGDRLTWRVWANNAGPDDAYGVVVTDTLPAGLDLISTNAYNSNWGGRSCSVDAGVVTCDMGDLPAGGQSYVDITAWAPQAATQVTNSAGARSLTPDPDDSNDHATVVTSLQERAETELSVVKNAGDTLEGDTIFWSVDVTNTGGTSAGNVVLTDTLPAGATASYVSGWNNSLGQALDCTTLPGQVVCDVGYLDAGSNAYLEIRTTAPQVDGSGEQLNTASVSSDDDPDGATGSKTVAVLDRAPDLHASASALPGTVEQFDPLIYRPQITNEGTASSSGATLTMTIPAGTRFMAARGTTTENTRGTDSSTTCTLAGDVVTCAFAAIASGQSRAAEVIVVPEMTGTISATFEVSPEAGDVDVDDLSATVTTTVVEPTGPNAVRNLPGFFANTLTGTDDSPSANFSLPFSLNYFGTTYNSVWVNPNGNVTFGSAYREYSPVNLNNAGLAIIAAFSTDWDTRALGTHKYQYGVDTVDGRPAFGLNMIYGGQYNSGIVPNSMQIVLVDRSDRAPGDFDMELNYDHVKWGTASAGFSAGTNVPGTFYQLPGSSQSGAFLDTNTNTGLIHNSINSPDQLGRYRFQVNDGTVIQTDLWITKGDTPDPVAAGATLAYTLTVGNDGPQDAPPTVSDVLPEGVTYLSSSSETGSCSAPGSGSRTVTCSLAELAVGMTDTITVNVQVRPDYRGTLTNTASVASPGADVDLSDNEASQSTTVEAHADLSLSKWASDYDLIRGESLSYYLQAYNAGPSAALNTVITDSVPAGLDITSATYGSTACAVSGQEVSCPIGTLNPGWSSSQVTINVTTDAVGTFTNDGSVTSDDDSATASVDVTVNPDEVDLEITKTSGDPTPIVDEAMFFDLSTYNHGPATARDVVVTDSVPAEFRIDGVSDPDNCAVEGQLVTCDYGNVGVNGNHWVRIDVTPLDDAVLVSNTAHVSSSSDEVADEQYPNSAAVDMAIAPNVVDLEASKFSSRAEGVVDEQQEFQLYVANHGPAIAKNVVLTDSVPSNFRIDEISYETDAAACAVTGQEVRCDFETLPVGWWKGAHVKVTPVTASAEGVTNTVHVSTDPDREAANGGTYPNSASVEVLIHPNEADLEAHKSTSRSTHVVDEPETFYLYVANHGPAIAHDVTLTDLIPANWRVDGFDYETTPGACTITGQLVSCDYGDLLPGSGQWVYVNVTPTTAGIDVANATNVGASNAKPDGTYADSQQVVVDILPNEVDLRAVKSGPSSAVVGVAHQFYLQASNDGPAIAPSVTLSDTVPSNWTITGIAGQSHADACSVTGQQVNCAFGDLADNASGWVYIDVMPVTASPLTADPDDAEDAREAVRNTAAVASTSANLVNTDNDRASVDTVIQPDEVDLFAEKWTNRNPGVVNEQQYFWMRVVNAGPAAADNVTLSDTIDAAFQVDGFRGTPPAGCSITGQDVLCQFGDLAPGQSGTVEVNVTPLEAGDHTNTVEVDSDTAEKTLGDVHDNRVTISAPVVDNRVALSPQKTMNRQVAVEGEPLTFTLSVHNNGPAAANDVTLADSIDPDFEHPTITGGTDTSACAVTGQGVNCTFPSVPSGSSAYVDVTVTPTAGSATLHPDGTAIDGRSAYSNTLDVDASNPKRSGHVSSVTLNGIHVVPDQVDIYVGKYSNLNHGRPGEQQAYWLEAGNASYATASNVVISDTIAPIFGIDGFSGVDAGESCSLTGRVVECTFSSVAPNGNRGVWVNVTPTGAANDIPNAVELVSVDEADLDASNDRYQMTSRVSERPTADLVIPVAIEDQPVTATLNASDPEGDALTYEVHWGDGAWQSGAYTPGMTIDHTYATPGVRTALLRVSDGGPIGWASDLPEVDVEQVVVDPGQPVVANAGPDIATFANLPTGVNLDGTETTPENDPNLAFSWTLTPEGTTTGAPRSHNGRTWRDIRFTDAEQGSWLATLTVENGSESSSDTARITVGPEPEFAGLEVTVVEADGTPDDLTNNPKVGGAQVLVLDANGVQFEDDSEPNPGRGDYGVAFLQGLGDGEYTVYVVKDGYRPNEAQAAVLNNQGEVTVVLEQGEMAAAVLTAERLTTEQAVELGVDPDDPDNQNVYEFEIHLAIDVPNFVPVVFSGYTAPNRGFFGGTGFAGGGSGGGCTSSRCTLDIGGGYDLWVEVRYVEGTPTLMYMVLPARAKWMKEFYDVQLTVTNLGSESFTLTDGVGYLNMPQNNGLGLSALFGQPQQNPQPMEDIPGGESRSVRWVVRGDVEGLYGGPAAAGTDHDLFGTYAGVLQPVGRPINLEARLADPIKVWGLGAMRVEVVADSAALARNPYDVTVTLRNVTDSDPDEQIPLDNVSLELLTEGTQNFIYQPGQLLERSAARLEPGETLSIDAVLIPHITGNLNLAQSFVRKKASGEVDDTAIITSQPAPTTRPGISGGSTPTGVHLEWDAIPGATGYELWATPDIDTHFTGSPLLTVGAGVTEADLVRPGGTAEYAVVPLFGAVRDMRHALLQLESGAPAGNVAPTADPKDETVTHKDADGVEIELSGSDANFDPLTYRVVLAPNHGSVVITDNIASYIPNDPSGDYVGGDLFQYVANDGELDSEPATVTLALTNRAPDAVNDSFDVNGGAGTPLAVTTNDTDADGDTLTVTSSTNGTNGTVSCSGGSCTYTPAPGYMGTDTFSYTVTDGHGDTDTANVTVTVLVPWQSSPQGDWVGEFGTVGYILGGWNSSSDLSSLPVGVTYTVERGSRYAWTASTSSVAALESPDESIRRPAAVYDATQARLRLSFADAFNGRLHIYAEDWANAGRRETVTVTTPNSTMKSQLQTSFASGAWMDFPVNVPGGSTLLISADRTAGPNAVINGVFLDGLTRAIPTMQSPQGNWVDYYGGDGYVLPAWNGTTDLSSLPAGATATLVAGNRHQWNSGTTAVQALQAPDKSTRRVGAYYSATDAMVRLDFSNGYHGPLRVYAVDWSNVGRRQTVTIAGGMSYPKVATLDSSFGQGAWMTVTVDVAPGGSVTITAHRLAGDNAVISGIFLGDKLVPAVQAPQGNWVDSYGGDGYVLAGFDGASDRVNLPTGVSISLERGNRHRWATSTSSVSALQSPDKTTRNVAAFYDTTQLRFRLNFASSYSGVLHLYALDWANTGRRQTVSVTDGSGLPRMSKLSSSFANGAWMDFPVTVPAGGSVVVTADREGTNNALISGIFLGGLGVVPTTSPQGDWVGRFGSQGYVLPGWAGGSDLASLPAGVGLNVVPGQGTRHCWNTGTTAVQALQSPDASTRKVCAIYSNDRLGLQMTFAAGYTGTLRLYSLDWTSTGRRQLVTVSDGTTTRTSRLESFGSGAWMAFPVSVPPGGMVTITADRLGTNSALVNGIFLD